MRILQMEERLWEYIDGLSTDEEKAAIDQLLYSSSDWKLKYNELLELSVLLNNTALEEPSMRFTRNVMEEIAKYQIAPATKTYINKKIIYGLGGFFITMIVGLIVYFIAQVTQTKGSASTGFAEDINKVSWSEVLNSTYINIFLMVNLVLGLMLLDKYLTTKKEVLKQRKA